MQTHAATATVSSGTSGVGEAVVAFVERHGIDVLLGPLQPQLTLPAPHLRNPLRPLMQKLFSK